MNDANVKIKLRLVYVELWNQHDLFDVSSNARQALTGFLRYRKDTLTHVHFNYAHFIRLVNYILLLYLSSYTLINCQLSKVISGYMIEIIICRCSSIIRVNLN